jgi:serine/threonine-protein kinase
MPTLVAVNTATYAMQLEHKWHLAPIVIGCLSLLFPLGFELARVTDSSYRFQDGVMTVVPRAIELPPGPTIVFLAVTAVAMIITGSVSSGHVRDALSDAERRLYMYTWHLRELIPTKAQKQTDPAVAKAAMLG